MNQAQAELDIFSGYIAPTRQAKFQPNRDYLLVIILIFILIAVISIITLWKVL